MTTGRRLSRKRRRKVGKRRGLRPPFPPMEALLVDEIPVGGQWQYEPKWDGFRCLAFRDGSKVELQSKSGQPLARYFPEVVANVLKVKAKQFVLDGEIVVPVDGRLSFDDLLQRIHPAKSRIEKLSRETPGVLVVFDLLKDDKGKVLTGETLASRRKKLEAFARKYLPKDGPILLSPATRDIAVAQRWFKSAGGGLDGIIAKDVTMDYRSGERTGMRKIKRMRTAECVVGGFRYASKGKVVGSLLLGLYDGQGRLNHVGFTSSFKHAERKPLTKKIEKLRKPIEKGGGFTGNAPGGPSRWSTDRSAEWEALDPKLVVEVRWDHFTGDRFRHGTKFLRWRPDKAARSCTMDQVVPRKSGGGWRAPFGARHS